MHDSRQLWSHFLYLPSLYTQYDEVGFAKFSYGVGGTDLGKMEIAINRLHMEAFFFYGCQMCTSCQKAYLVFCLCQLGAKVSTDAAGSYDCYMHSVSFLLLQM